jgi:hypothetical protein
MALASRPATAVDPLEALGTQFMEKTIRRACAINPMDQQLQEDDKAVQSVKVKMAERRKAKQLERMQKKGAKDEGKEKEREKRKRRRDAGVEEEEEVSDDGKDEGEEEVGEKKSRVRREGKSRQSGVNELWGEDAMDSEEDDEEVEENDGVKKFKWADQEFQEMD